MKDNQINYEEAIMDFVHQNPQGLTLADIINGIQASRNTVSKYIISLEAKKKVINKKIGAYNFYFPADRRFLPQDRIINYFKEWLYCLKKYIPNINELAKQIGNEARKYFQIALTNEITLGNTNEEIIKLVKVAYPGLDPFQEATEVKIIEFNEDKTRAIYRFKNSSFIEDIGDCAAYYHLVCGFTETFIFNILNRKVRFDVLRINDSKIKSESYIDLEIEFLD